MSARMWWMIWVGGEGEAGSCRPCRPETPARQSKQAAPGTQEGRVLGGLVCGVGVSGSQEKATKHGEGSRREVSKSRAIPLLLARK